MYITLTVISVIFVSCVFTYNSLINKENVVSNAEAGIDVMLKKRADMIPNLVFATKACLKYEQSILTKLTELRCQAISDGLTHKQKVDLDKQMTQAFSDFKVSVEAYPDLKTSEQFIVLQRSINETEEQISAARRTFNSAITELNNAVKMFPSNIFANKMNIKTRPLFEIPVTEKANPDIGALFGNE